MAFREVARLDDVWPGVLRGVVVEARRVLLVNVDEELCAYEDRCPHLGVPLSHGTLDGCVLRCSAHHHEYDVRSGAGLNPRGAQLVRVPLRVEDGAILVDVAAAAPRPQAPAASDDVGPVLAAGEVGHAIAAVIRALNPGVVIHDRGAYLRVLAPRRCVVTRAALVRALGRELHLPAELELVMPSFKGRLVLGDDEASWSFEGP